MATTVSSVSVTLSRSLHWGVSFQNGTYSRWTNQTPTLHAYVPPHTESFQFGFLNGSVEIKNGTKYIGPDFLATTDPKKSKIVVEVPRKSVETKGSEVIWTFTFPTKAG